MTTRCISDPMLHGGDQAVRCGGSTLPRFIALGAIAFVLPNSPRRIGRPWPRLGELIERRDPVVILVETDFRDDDRPADGPARIFVAILGLLLAKLVEEPFVGFEFLVAIVVIRAAVELAGAVLDGHVHLAAVAGAVLGSVVAGEQLPFADGVDRGRLIRAHAGRAAILSGD